MSNLNQRLKLALLKRNKSGNSLEQGFTLVELMVVIVIVGILSAVALPNFMSQTDKAKATEATTKISALLKEAYSEYQYDGDIKEVTTTMKAKDGPIDTASLTGKFTYTLPAASGNVFNILATGKADDDQLNGKLIYGCIDLSTGGTDVSKKLLAKGTSSDASCT